MNSSKNVSGDFPKGANSNAAQLSGLKCDVLVIGSGGAGLLAAIRAREGGARVIVAEKSTKVGGTTSFSGGTAWIPGNHHMAEMGISDSRREAFDYIKKVSRDSVEDELIYRFIDEAPEMLRYLESTTGLKFSVVKFPDFHEFSGAKAVGRVLDPGLFNVSALKEFASILRRPPSPSLLTLCEIIDLELVSKPQNLPLALLQQRSESGSVAQGTALVGGLLEDCLKKGVEFLLESSATELLMEGDRIIGAALNTKAGGLTASVTKGVILASGGFEWSDTLKRKFLPVPVTHQNSFYQNIGDGLKMAMVAGADLANMCEASWAPSIHIPGSEYESQPYFNVDFAARGLPHSIVVNRRGERFVNESINFNDFGRSFLDFDTKNWEFSNSPSWLIFDQNYLEKYRFFNVIPGEPVPEWIKQAASPQALAKKIEISEAGLTKTIERFNQFASRGVDSDFNRGSSPYDRLCGDLANKPNSSLGVLEKAPYYAVPVHLGALSTKGGVKVNTHGQALKPDGTVIKGLYAVGSVMAGIAGPGYFSYGGTIGVNLTFGYIAGRHVVEVT